MNALGQVLDAAGPEQIRAAFTTAITTTADHTGDLTGIAGVLREAADRYETLQMTASTLGHLRAGAAALAVATAAAGAAGEQLQAALADFDHRDGRVGDAVAEAGNLMQAEGYTIPVGHPHPSAHSQEVAVDTDTAATGTATPAPDKLRLAGRMALQPGESVTGSSAMDTLEGVVCAVGVASPDGPRVHVGLNIYDGDATRWRGADRGSTLVFDAAAAQQLQHAADAMAAAEQAGRDRDRELRGTVKALEKQRNKLLKKQYGDLAAPIGELLDEIDIKQFNIRHTQPGLDGYSAMLSPQERDAYSALAQEITAEVAKPPVDTDLDTPCTIDRQRIDELRKQQKAILAGLTPDELRTMEYLEDKRPRSRTWGEEQQLHRLHHAPGGIQQRAEYRDGKDITGFDGYARKVDNEVIGIARNQRSISQLRSRATPHPALDAQITAADTAFQQANSALFAYRDGTELGAGRVPAQWGALVWTSTIGEEGHVRHHLYRQPPDADPDWEPDGDPVLLTLAGVRKFTALVGTLLAAGQRQQPTGRQS